MGPVVTRMNPLTSSVSEKEWMVEKVCSQIDPFCRAARGGRYIDQFNLNTHTYQTRSIQKVTTVATGDIVNLYAGTVDSKNWRNSGTGVLTNGGDSAVDSNWDTIVSNTSAARLVSFGIHFWPLTNASTNGGYVEVVRGSAGESYSQTSLNLLADYPETEVFDWRNEFCVVGVPCNPKFREFVVPITSAGPGVANAFFTDILIHFVGPVSSDLGFIEIVYNYEYVAKAKTATSTPGRDNRVISQEVQHSVALDQTTRAVQSNLPAVFLQASKDVGRFVINEVLDYMTLGASSVIRKAVSGLTRRVPAALSNRPSQMTITNID